MDDETAIEGQYPNVLRAILGMPWAIDHESVAWAAIVDVLALRSVGRGLTDEEITARIAGAKNGPRQGGGRAGGGIGIYTLPIYGVITPRGNMMARSSGGTTAESILTDFRAAMADPAVDAIVMDIDSPGGAVEGIDELAAEIRAARGTKPIVAVANYMAASAAFWIASAADEIVASPSAMVGSIGVFTAHDDISEAQAKLGIKRTVISAGKHKAEGALGRPLSEDALAHVQGQVDEHYSAMTTAISKGRTYGARKVSVELVRGASWGEGRGLLAKPALAAGMIDSIDTLDNTIRRVARGVATSQRQSALAAFTPDEIAALASGLPYSDHVSLASAVVTELQGRSQTRAELRAAEGRPLSEATRTGLAGLGFALSAIAGSASAEPDPDGDDEDDEDTEPETTTEPTARAVVRADLEILEAALLGGYALPH